MASPAKGPLPAHLTAPAKLTRSLRVVGMRPDGMHLLDAEMVSLDLADVLELRSGDGLVVEGPAGTALAPGAGGPGGPDNLVARALAAVGRTAAVRLVKRIPVGAGLGGGSSDAAAVLRWAGVAPDRAGLDLAAALGADVPFCLVGGRARVGGIGELVEPLPAVDLAFTLVLPPFGVSTAAVYRRWDEMAGTGTAGPAEGGNDLEAAALAVEPRLALWRDALGSATGERPRLAGSGSTWFVEGERPELVGRMDLGDGGGSGTVIVARTTGSTVS